MGEDEVVVDEMGSRRSGMKPDNKQHQTHMQISSRHFKTRPVRQKHNNLGTSRLESNNVNTDEIPHYSKIKYCSFMLLVHETIQL